MSGANLVIGAAGTVGEHVVSELVARGRHVRCVSRNAKQHSEHHAYSPSTVEWIDGDALDFGFVNEVCQGASVVYNTAGIVDFSRRNTARMWAANVRLTANIVEAALRNNTAQCHLSSVFALGHPADGGNTVSEASLWTTAERRSAYAKSMFRREMEIMRGMEEGAQAVIVEAGAVVGGAIFRRAMQLRGELRQCNIPIVDARDVAVAMVQLVEHELFGDRYIAVAENISIGDMQKQYNALAYHRLRRIWFNNSELALELRHNYTYPSDKLRSAIDMHFAPLQTSLRTAAQTKL